MTTHRFTVNVPNPTTQRASVQLRLEPAKRQGFSWLPREFPKAGLKVIAAGLALDACAEEGNPTLKLKLEPFTSIDVHAVVNTAPSKKPGVAGFHLVDHRKGKDVGGVFLVCIDPPLDEPVSQTITTPNPCPATLARNLYLIQPGDDPSKVSRIKSVRPGDILDLVAQITNPTGKSLKNTQVYLEHLGVSNVEFTPSTWNIGTLGKGAVFYATWPIRITAWQTGSFEPSVVVLSQRTDPVRLNGKLSLAFRKELGAGSSSNH
ncbi:hypothetical protein HZA56_20540 [Candidatus Poribacteria bacterium]|nr:hypothetical protein [Candidatus Poribacteria bacterium]